MAAVCAARLALAPLHSVGADAESAAVPAAIPRPSVGAFLWTALRIMALLLALAKGLWGRLNPGSFCSIPPCLEGVEGDGLLLKPGRGGARLGEEDAVYLCDGGEEEVLLLMHGVE